MACLGSVLINPETIVNLVELDLKPEDFHIVRNRWIWEAMLYLYENSTGGILGIDFRTIASVLEGRGRLTECGGEGYLTELLSVVPTYLHAVAYGQIVLQASTRRKLIEAATNIARLAYESEETPEKLLDDALLEIEKSNGRKSDTGMRTWYEATLQQVENIKEAERLRGEGKSLYIPTGFAGLDYLLDGGLAVTEVMFLIADPKTGKSLFLKDLAVSAAIAHVPVLVFSLEMVASKYVKRDLHQFVPSVRQKTGEVNEGDWQMIQEYVALSKNTNIVIDETADLTLSALRAKVRRWKRECASNTPQALVIVDYIQLIDSGLDGRATDSQKADHNAKFMKVLAGQEKVAIVSASSISKHEGRAAKTTDMRFGFGQQHHADILAVMNLVGEEDIPSEQDKEIDLDLLNRDGAEGRIHLLMRRQKLKFEEIQTKTLPNAYEKPETS